VEPYRTRLDAVPHVAGLKREEGWVDMQVQFLVDRATVGSEDFLLGWTVLPPGARHERHRHPNADEFFIVLDGEGMIYTDDSREPSTEGDVVFTPRGHWHGFDNTGDDDVVLVWGWSGAGSLEAAGYEIES
jgi:quercetin dioxygenase-like cupin family protein